MTRSCVLQILNSTPILNEDRSIDGVGVAQPTRAEIREEDEWELKHLPIVEDHPFPSVPPPFFPDLLGFLPSLIFHVYLHPWKYPLLIIHKTHRMLVHNLTMERTDHYLNIHLIIHLSFLEIKRMNILASHLPLCAIHRIMRMTTNILHFMILVVVISSPNHLITMLIQSLLIHLRHRSTMIHLSTKMKPPRLLRHFRLS